MDPTLPKKSLAAQAAQRAAQRHEAMRKEHEQKRAASEHKREDVTQAKSQKLTAAKKETISGRIDNPYHKPYGTGVVSPPGNKSPQSWDYRATTEAVVRKYKKPNLADKQIMGLNATFSAKADDTKDAGMAQNPYESTRYVIPAEREPMDRADGVEVGYDKSVEPADKNMQLKRRKALKLAQMYRIDEDGGLGGDSGLGAGVSPMPGSFGGSSGATATRITGNPDGTGNYMLKGKTNKMKTLKTFKNEMGTPNKPFYNFGEEAEQVDEISTKLANKYFSKASKQSQKPDAKNRDAGMGMAYAKVQGRHANVPTTEAHDWTDDYKIGDHKALTHYANTKGGIDKEEMLKAAHHIKTGNLPALDKHLRQMDTAPRDKVIDYIDKKHHDALGFEALSKSNHKESTDVSEASKRDAAVRKFMSHDPEAGERILAMGKKEKETEKAFKSGKAEINRLKKMGEEFELSETVDPVEARDFLDTHGMRNKDFHSLSSDHVNRLLTHMKKHGYKAGPNSPGSPARMYHSHLERLANGISKHEKMRSNSAFTGYKEEVMSEGELDGGSMSGKANDALEVGSVDSAKTKLMGKVKKVQEMAVRDAAGKKHTIKNVEIRMADGTLKSLPPGKSGSSGGGGK